MDDQEDNLSSDPKGFDSLFIQEEDGVQEQTVLGERVECNSTQSQLAFTGTLLNHSAQIRPYLMEMDDLLKSCDELAGVAFGPDSMPSYTDAHLSGSKQIKAEVMKDRYRETSVSPQPYLSTTYIDTRVDRNETEHVPMQAHQQDLGFIMNRYGESRGAPSQSLMPLTSAGAELSGTMAEYQTQLMGMLAMLENCMEEAGMDFDPQEWATDASQEYVHVRQDHSHRKSTSLGPMEEGGKIARIEAQTAPSQPWVSQPVDGITVQGSREEVMLGSATKESTPNPCIGQDRACVSVERLERSDTETGVSVDFLVDLGTHEPQLKLLSPSMTTKNTGNESGRFERASASEETNIRGHISKMDVENSDALKPDTEMEVTGQSTYTEELQALGAQVNTCIEEVQHLEKKREELLKEVLRLRGEEEEEAMGSSEEKEREEGGQNSERKVAELMAVLKREAEESRVENKKEVQTLREQRAEEERRVWKVILEREALQEETRRLKRRLFAVARDCAYSQAAMKTQHRVVERLKEEEEQMQFVVLQLTKECSQLRSDHPQQLSSLEAQFSAQCSSQTPRNTQEELTQCRRDSCGDIEQYLQGELKALEARFEPMVVALLKRKEAIAVSLVQVKEQSQELRVKVGPLRDESQRLKLQRACLEERLKLMHTHRREDMVQHKETVSSLEESSRELKTELNIQKRKTKEMEELKESLNKQLLLYRAAIEDHNKENT